LGFAVLGAGVRSEEPVVLVVVGLVVLAVPAVADGPLTALRVVGRPAHRWFDAAVALGLLVLAIAGSSLGGTARATLAATSVVFAGFVLKVDYRPAKRLRRLRPDPEDLQGSARSEAVGRRAGAAVGQKVVVGRDAAAKAGDVAGKSALAASRGLGRVAGSGLKAYRKRKGP
jgi:hypothetical protein